VCSFAKASSENCRKVRDFFSSSNRHAFRFIYLYIYKKKNIIERLSEIASLRSDFDLTEQTINGHVLARETELKPFFRAFLDLSEETRIKKTSLPHSNSWI
jgi:hypothetical protein